jgi:ABC-type multidrug transport system ATPase subunit
MFSKIKMIDSENLENEMMDKLKEVDLQDVSHSLVKTYSGGMKRYYI